MTIQDFSRSFKHSVLHFRLPAHFFGGTCIGEERGGRFVHGLPHRFEPVSRKHVSTNFFRNEVASQMTAAGTGDIRLRDLFVIHENNIVAVVAKPVAFGAVHSSEGIVRWCRKLIRAVEPVKGKRLVGFAIKVLPEPIAKFDALAQFAIVGDGLTSLNSLLPIFAKAPNELTIFPKTELVLEPVIIQIEN